MTKRQKIIQKIKDKRDISFEEAENLLLSLGFKKKVKGSHNVFRKEGEIKHLTLTKKSQLKKYQVELLKEFLENYER